MKRFFSIALLSVFILLCGCSQGGVAEKSLFLMDTAIGLRLWGDNREQALREISEKLLLFDRDFSHTKEEGELVSINSRNENSVMLSDEMRTLIGQAILLSEETQGAFDPTIAPAVNLWGIGTENERVPEEHELQDIKSKIGYQKLELSGNMLTLPRGFMLNFGAIAKGYASDVVRKILDKHDIPSAVISLGGNVYVRGARQDGLPWRVGVRDPNGGENDIIGIVSVTDEFLISSGDYERFFESDGVRYHHILDPKTAAPARNSLRAVAIVCDNGARGDAYSTALYVMGYETALEFWRSHNNFEAIFIFDDYNIVITEGLAGSFELSEASGGYTYEVAER